MQLACVYVSSGNPNVQCPAPEPDSDITDNNADKYLNQRDGYSCPDRDKTADKCKPHPNCGDKPDVLKHNSLGIFPVAIMNYLGFLERHQPAAHDFLQRG